MSRPPTINPNLDSNPQPTNTSSTSPTQATPTTPSNILKAEETKDCRECMLGVFCYDHLREPGGPSREPREGEMIGDERVSSGGGYEREWKKFGGNGDREGSDANARAIRYEDVTAMAKPERHTPPEKEQERTYLSPLNEENKHTRRLSAPLQTRGRDRTASTPDLTIDTADISSSMLPSTPMITLTAPVSEDYAPTDYEMSFEVATMTRVIFDRDLGISAYSNVDTGRVSGKGKGKCNVGNGVGISNDDEEGDLSLAKFQDLLINDPRFTIEAGTSIGSDTGLREVMAMAEDMKMEMDMEMERGMEMEKEMVTEVDLADFPPLTRCATRGREPEMSSALGRTVPRIVVTDFDVDVDMG